MTKNAALPSYRETADFIRNDAFYNARNAVSHMQLYSINGNTFTIGPGTPFHTQISLNPDGTLNFHHDQGHLLLYQPPYSRRDIFTRTWWHILEKAKDTLKALVKNTLDMSLNDSLDQAEIEAQADNGEKTLDKVLFHTADGIRSTIGHGYLQNPASLGYGTFRNFTGRERVNNVLSIAGPKATLDDYNLIVRHQEHFTKAMQTNPNAVTLWILHRRNNYENQSRTDPGNILQEAEQLFIRIAKDDFAHDPEELWETVSRLNHTAIARHVKSQWELVSLSNLVHGANANPSYTALTTLIKAHGHQKIAHPFIRESQARLRQRGKSQHQLATQYFIIIAPHMFPDIVRANEIQRAYHNFIEQTPGDPCTPWREVLEFFPPEVAGTLETRDHRGRRKTAPKSNPKVNRLRPQAPTHEELAEILDGPARDFLHHLIDKALTLQTVPGRYLQLTALEQTEPVLRMVKLPDSTITHQSNAYTVNGDLPSPTDTWWTNIHWTTRGLKQSIITRALHQHLETNWQQLKPRPDAALPSAEKLTTHIRQRLEQASIQNYHCKTEAQLSSDLIGAVASLVDPELHRVLSETCQNVDIAIYNMAAPAKDIFKHLHGTNPGALTWLMSTDPPRTTPKHPGELIAKAKHSLKEAGLQPTAWKSAATLSTEIMMEITTVLTDGEPHPTPPEHRTKLLNIIAANNITTSPSNIYPALQTLRTIGTLRRIRSHTTEDPLIDSNSQACAAIILRTDPDKIGQDFQNIADYARDMTIESNPITCRNWNTLQRASERWHREIKSTPTKQKWNRLLDQQNSYYRAWPMALDTHQDGDYTIVPLSSEYDLFQESLQMDHCVISYGDDCALHNSRIFSIIETKENKRLATTELRKQGGRWMPTQTRGRKNHPPHHNVLETVERLAQRYQEAKGQDAAHTFSWVHETTRETFTEHPNPRPEVWDQDHPEVWDQDHLPF